MVGGTLKPLKKVGQEIGTCNLSKDPVPPFRAARASTGWLVPLTSSWLLPVRTLDDNNGFFEYKTLESSLRKSLIFLFC